MCGTVEQVASRITDRTTLHVGCLSSDKGYIVSKSKYGIESSLCATLPLVTSPASRYCNIMSSTWSKIL